MLRGQFSSGGGQLSGEGQLSGGRSSRGQFSGEGQLSSGAIVLEPSKSICSLINASYSFFKIICFHILANRSH